MTGASAYPGGLDIFAKESPTTLRDLDGAGRDHPARHDDIEAAMVAVQVELGVNPSGDAPTVAARLGTLVGGSDPRLSDARTPVAHAASHAAAGSDPVTAADIGGVPAGRTVSAGTGLTGGGDLTANRTLSANFGTTAGTIAQGSDPRLSDARTPVAHAASHAAAGSDPVTITPAQVTGTAIIADDWRLTNARTPVAHAASHAAAGSDPVTLAQSQVTNLAADLAAKAPLASPALSGVPTAPTAAVGTSTTQVASTAFVLGQAAATAGNLVTAAQSTPAVGSLALSGCTEASGLVLTASGSGAFTASVSGVAVVVGQVYTVSAILAPSGRAVATRISWRNSGGSEISAVAGDSVAAGASAITSMATGVAPAGAVTMIAYAAYASTGSAGDAVTVTKFGVWAGAGGSWAAPGTPIANLGRRVTHPNTDDVLVRVWDGDAGRWQTAHYDSGWRDVSSLLNSTDWALSDSIGYCRARATYGEVEVIGRLKRVTAGANRNFRTVMLTMPTGFGGPKGYVPTGVFWVSDTLPLGMISDLGAENRLDANIPGASSGTWGTGDQCSFRAKFARVSTIPTTLPGTLASSAPA